VKLLISEANEKVTNIVQLIYFSKKYEGVAKDFEFSRRTMEEHWSAGYQDALESLSHPEVLQPPSRLEGVRTFDFGHFARSSLMGRQPRGFEMKERDVRKTGIRDAADEPGLSDRPYRFHNREFLIITYRTDRRSCASSCRSRSSSTSRL
jgi:hypothetical protein